MSLKYHLSRKSRLSGASVVAVRVSKAFCHVRSDGTSQSFSSRNQSSFLRARRTALPYEKCQLLSTKVPTAWVCIWVQISVISGCTCDFNCDKIWLGREAEYQRWIRDSALSKYLSFLAVSCSNVVIMKRSIIALRATTWNSRSFSVTPSRPWKVSGSWATVLTTLRKSPDA